MVDNILPMIAEVVGIRDDEARVNVTYGGGNGELRDPVSVDATDGDIRQWVTEAVQHGSIPGIRQDAHANFTDFVVERFTRTEERPYNLMMIRPKTPFGAGL